MDTNTLVDEQLEAGKQFVAALLRDGIPVQIAFWHRAEEAAPWSFCIATPLVERDGLLAAARKVVAVRRSFGPDFAISPTDVSIIKGGHPLAKAVLSGYPRPPKRAGWEDNPPLVNGWELASDYPQWYQVYRDPRAVPVSG